jgi:hypothetical protein
MSSEKIFTPPHPLNTAVLFLVFNRLDTTQQVFSAIRQAKPPRLYIASDGARKTKAGEAEKVTAVRDFIQSSIDWKCDIQTLFRDKNLGCKYAVSGAIDWFFENEEMGIILEDDCLPSQSFFWFCEELLGKYKDDMRVWHISGDNFQEGARRGEGDYYYSKYTHIWGWASWANRWQSYDVKMESYKYFYSSNQLLNIFNNKNSQKYWADIFLKVVDGQIDTWDYQWAYTVLSNSGLSILPNKNLISNIGFGPDATHTMDLDSQHSKLDRADVSFPLKHPKLVVYDRLADDFTESKMFAKRSILLRGLSRIKRIFR